ncbi:hypothetical protein GGQ95_003217 [Anoxybacillus rupiensis]|nr:hypothetical protein [Anoxybacillus rupiensis]
MSLLQKQPYVIAADPPFFSTPSLWPYLRSAFFL